MELEFMNPIKGLISGDELLKCYKKRLQEFDYLSINKKLFEDYQEKGWKLETETDTRFRIRRKKSIGDLFENEVWCAFAKMGFNEMNGFDDLKIDLNENGTINPKQIDVFAKDEETVIIIECKSSSEFGSKSFRLNLLEINGYRDHIIKSIHSHYKTNENSKLKIGFVLATKNAGWSESDTELAKENDICILTEDDIVYYQRLASHIGPVAKYQLLADIFQDKQIPGLEARVPAIRGRIGNYKFYAFAIEPSKLLPISFVSHRAKVDKQNLTTYQRMLSKKRLISIKEYIENEKGLFPNSIIINFITGKYPLTFEKTETSLETEAQLGYLNLPNRYKSAWIIDGQHRLYGFSGTTLIDKVTLPVVAFENLDATTQAKMFVDINSKQQKVKKNHLEDMYADLLWDSKIEGDRLLALRSKVVSELGDDRLSPFYNKIKSASGESDGEPLTIGAITEAIDKNRLLGQITSGVLRPGPLYCLKDPKMDNSKKRAKKILSSYFDNFKNGLSNNWSLKPRDGGFFCSNVGVSALMKVLKEIIEHISFQKRLQAIDIDTDFLIDEIKIYSEPIIQHYSMASSFDEIKGFKLYFGAGGSSNAALAIMEQIHSAYPEFNPAGLEKYMSDKKAQYTEKSLSLIKEIQLALSSHIISILKNEYGSEDDAWWFASIPTEVKKKAAEKQAEDTIKRPLEQCLDLIHYQKILIKNWKLLGSTYSLGIKGSKEKQLEWFDKFNRIRNIAYHPENGPVSKEEYDYLVYLKNAIEQRIEESSKKQKIWEEEGVEEIQ
jgi:DNA sulfur modification protein DndB